ncbi:MAG: RDD family protein [Acidobacteria bacterium]|nr:MAG: RDD family protein [Acidobacteriota bacterium]
MSTVNQSPLVLCSSAIMEKSELAPTETPTIYAGFWLRLAAALIDVLAMFIPFCTIALFAIVFIKLVSKAGGYDPVVVILTILPPMAIVATWLYFAVMESSSWQATIGKKVLGLYVTDMQGRRLTLSRATGRTFAKYLSSMTAGVGYVLCGVTNKKQALHDIVANCLVLRRPQ